MGMALFLVGFVVLCVGFISVIKPIRKLRIETRKTGVIVFFVGLIMFITGPLIRSASIPPLPPPSADRQPIAPTAPARQDRSVATSVIAPEMTIEEYIDRCSAVSAAEFEDKCKGKTVTFDGKIRRIVKKDTLEVDVYSSSGKKQGYDLLLSSRRDWNDSWKSYEGRSLRFSGALKDNNYRDHDIEDGIVVSLGTAEDAIRAAEARRRKNLQMEAEKAGFDSVEKYEATKKVAEEREAACREDWSKCETQSDLINNYQGISLAKVMCKMQAEEMAKYGDPDFPWLSFFDTFYKNEKSYQSGRVTLIEPAAKFQNVFGAMAKTRVTCLYDLRTETVVSINIL